MIDVSNKLMPPRKTQAKWLAYVFIIPYIYIMVMVDEKQEKVFEVRIFKRRGKNPDRG